MGRIKDAWDAWWRKPPPPPRPRQPRWDRNHLWTCTRCGKEFTGNPKCPACGRDNSRERTVDDPVEPQRWVIPDLAIKTLILAALAGAGYAAATAVGVGTGGLAPAVVVIGVGLASAGSADASTPPGDSTAGVTGTDPGAPPLGPRPPKVNRPPGSDDTKYYIYAVNTSGWSLYIGRPADVEGRPSRSFTDGGTGDAPIEFEVLVGTPFNSAEEAKEYLRTRVTPGKESVWTGRWVKFEGGEYRALHVGL